MQDTSSVTLAGSSDGILLIFCHDHNIGPTVGIQIDRQFDFWLLWLGTMFVLALPLFSLKLFFSKAFTDHSITGTFQLYHVMLMLHLDGVWLVGSLLILFLFAGSMINTATCGRSRNLEQICPAKLFLLFWQSSLLACPLFHVYF